MHNRAHRLCRTQTKPAERITYAQLRWCGCLSCRGLLSAVWVAVQRVCVGAGVNEALDHVGHGSTMQTLPDDAVGVCGWEESTPAPSQPWVSYHVCVHAERKQDAAQERTTCVGAQWGSTGTRVQ